MDYNELWNQVLDKLEPEYEEEFFNEMFRSCSFVCFQKGNLVLAAPNDYVTTKLNKLYINKINTLLLSLNPNKEENIKAKIIMQDNIKDYVKPTSVYGKQENLENKYRNNLNANYNFANFVVGSSNRMTYLMSLKIADQPGTIANPVYIFGSVGLGKTHLMQSIGNHILDSDAQKRVLYVKASEFMEDYSKMSNSGRMDEFNDKYRNLDILLIDDIQVLEMAKKTQLEFFKVFDILYSANKQIVITSDRPAEELNIMDRLTSRFKEGLVLDIKTPGLDHRIDIVKRKMAENNINDIDEEVYNFIAENFVSNIREIEGAVTRLVMYCTIADIPINLDNTKEALQPLLSLKKNSKVTNSDVYSDVLGIVADFYNLTTEDIIGTSRKADIVRARQIAMYILKTNYGLAYKKIGNFCGGKDHSTVMSSVEKIEKELYTNPDLKMAIETINKKIG